MSQDIFRLFVENARIYRKHTVNPSIKGMIAAFDDMGVFDEAGMYFAPGHVHAENVWAASAA